MDDATNSSRCGSVAPAFVTAAQTSISLMRTRLHGVCQLGETSLLPRLNTVRTAKDLGTLRSPRTVPEMMGRRNGNSGQKTSGTYGGGKRRGSCRQGQDKVASRTRQRRAREMSAAIASSRAAEAGEAQFGNNTQGILAPFSTYASYGALVRGESSDSGVIDDSLPGYRDGLRPKQSLGQNFLRDKSMSRRIVKAFSNSVSQKCPDVGIVEVGSGTGALTVFLAEQYPQLHAFDIDQRAVAYLSERLPHVDVQRRDVLALRWDEIARQYGRDQKSLAVIGNLPYNIVSQILFSMFEAPPRSVQLAVVMMQREVADRITAQTRSKPYGILSVIAQLYSKPKLLFGVPSTCFTPRPNVESAIVEFEFCPHEELDVYNTTLTTGLRRVVREAFQQRRKTLRNSLRNLCGELGRELPYEIEGRRPEELEPIEFVHLTKFIFAKQLESPDVVDPDVDSPKPVWRDAPSAETTLATPNARAEA